MSRRERLTAIAAEYTEEVHDPRAEAALRGPGPVPRFAAVTSEGSIDSSHASNGCLIVAESAGALAEFLRGECGEGWLAHGRVWDLDAPWHLWGNLEVTYPVRVGDAPGAQVQMVVVEGREDGVHLFEDRLDAEAFGEAVRAGGGRAVLRECPLHDDHAAGLLIAAERRA